MEEKSASKYSMTNKLIVVVLVFSILPALHSIAFVVLVLMIDVFAVLGMLSDRNDNPGIFPSGGILVLGLLLVALTIWNWLADFSAVDWGSLLLALYLVFIGIVFGINRWERNKAE
jgi:hypothetical protein